MSASSTTRVFSIPLQVVCAREGNLVPKVVSECIAFLRDKGMHLFLAEDLYNFGQHSTCKVFSASQDLAAV